MAIYSISRIQECMDHTLIGTVTGPGIRSSGVDYWFRTLDEVRCFAENLNLAYWESKVLSEIRQRHEKRNRRK
jgi:hypothetical protein